MYIKIKNLKIDNSRCLYYNRYRINRLKSKITSSIKDFKSSSSNYLEVEMFMPKDIIKFPNNNYTLAELIESITNNQDIGISEKNRLINIVNAYKFISKRQVITKDSLNELYNILSNNLLDKYEHENMGEYYRQKDVYILNSDYLDINYDKGLAPEKVDSSMQSIFEYLNNEDTLSQIDIFIKSQILHYYMIYVHPYFDINGRTSRMMTTWYLLNRNVSQYTIFNRAITSSKEEYKKSIQKSRKKGNITYFLEFILKSTLLEIEKERLIAYINRKNNLGVEERQILLSYLSLDDIPTTENIANCYNGYIPHKSIQKVVDDMIMPMIEKGIFLKDNSDKSKDTLKINSKLIENNKIKHYQKIKKKLIF